MSMFIYRSVYWAPGKWIVDCERHAFTVHSGLFAEAVGRAFKHRYEAGS